MVKEAQSVAAAILPPMAGMQKADPQPVRGAALPGLVQRSASASIGPASVNEAANAVFPRPSAVYARLQSAKDGLQNSALVDRQRLNDAETVQKLAREMRANLMAIVKNYPPFPPDSEDRKRYLEMVVGLRREMEALMVPPPDKGGPPALSEDGRAALGRLTPSSSDAEVAAAADALATLEAGLTGFGEEIKRRWVEQASSQAARQLSAATAEQLARVAGGIGTTARDRG
ncbi:hypothetical protein [Sulfuricystis multivorans]|uniref:hypothetical protein n=1 Tax=Sulfuricystis multivorans TaxID=2211108 RepID=UPI000F826C60|nr:hypothetical protein [Sulfuricystis multivorans]